MALDACWKKSKPGFLALRWMSCVGVTSPIHGDICFFQLSNGAGCRVQWDSCRRFQEQSLGGHKEPETPTQYMLLFSPLTLCPQPSTVCKLLLTLYHLMLTMRKKGSGKLKLPKATKQGPGQGWDTSPHSQYSAILPLDLHSDDCGAHRVHSPVPEEGKVKPGK